MAEAIFGLIGVIVGAIITGGGTLYIERRREMREIKLAKRLVADELRSIHADLLLLIEHETTPRPQVEDLYGTFLATTLWYEHKSVLADDRALSEEKWFLLSERVDSVRGQRLLLKAAEPGKPITEIPRLRRMAEQVDQAYEWLAGHKVDPE